MKRETLRLNLIEVVGEYGIQRCKERDLDYKGEPYGPIYTWYDVCLDGGDGDIVFSSKKLHEARKWAKEN